MSNKEPKQAFYNRPEVRTAVGIAMFISVVGQKRKIRDLGFEVKALQKTSGQTVKAVQDLIAGQNNHHDYLIWLGEVMPGVLDASTKQAKKFPRVA